MLYSDEDVVADDGSFARHIKPGWSPDHMTTLMYTCHLGVYRRELVVELGGFRSRFDGCQDYDLVLRLMERTERIAHIPRILYHWRAHEMSTAGGEEAKPYAYLTQPMAIAEHLVRSGIDADVQFAHLGGLHRIVHRVDRAVTVDLVLAVEETRGLADAARSWMAQPHRAWRVVLAAPDAIADDALSTAQRGRDPTALASPSSPDQDSAPPAKPPPPSTSCSCRPPLPDSPTTGSPACSATAPNPGSPPPDPSLLAPDGRIQQAGIALPDGIPLHVRHGIAAPAAPAVVHNVSAVSGILATPRDTYQHLGGLDPTYAELALIDYCLRAGQYDLRTVIVPDARLHTTGPDPTTNDLPTLRRLRNTWAQHHTHDPYYNPNYRTDRGDFVLRRY